MTINAILVTGGFDPLHSGNIKLLKDAHKLNNNVIVGLNSDEWLARKKGKSFMPYKEREIILNELNCVNKVISFDDSDNLEIQQRKYRAKFNSLPSNTKKILIEHYETAYNSDFSENMRDWRDNSIYETLMKDLQYYVRKKLVPNPQ